MKRTRPVPTKRPFAKPQIETISLKRLDIGAVSCWQCDVGGGKSNRR